MKGGRGAGRVNVALWAANLRKYLRAIGASIHPLRAAYEVCATLVVCVPFLVAYVVNRTAPLYVYLLYPALFLVSHLVWFRLPFVDRRVRWGLFWFTLSIIVALGAGFLYANYRESTALAGPLRPEGILWIPHWVNESLDVPFPTVAAVFLIPSACAAALYCLVLALFLGAYRSYRQAERRRREGKRTPPWNGPTPP